MAIKASNIRLIISKPLLQNGSGVRMSSRSTSAMEVCRDGVGTGPRSRTARLHGLASTHRTYRGSSLFRDSEACATDLAGNMLILRSYASCGDACCQG